MKYWLILPAMYAFLLLLFLIFFLISAGGHGLNPFSFVIDLMTPLCFLLNMLPASWGPQSGLLSFLLCALAGLVQWALIGYLIDKLRIRRRRKQPTQ